MHLNHSTGFDEYRKYIINYFDTCLDSRAKKDELLFNLKDYWEEFIQTAENFKWLDRDNKELVDWALNYFRSNNLPLDAVLFIKDSDTYGGVIAMFDLWHVVPDTKTLFVTKMKKALSQKNKEINGTEKKLTILLWVRI